MADEARRKRPREASCGRLAGQVAVVTGGGGGIGAAIAVRLAAEGACVAIFDLDRERAHRVQIKCNEAAAARESGGDAAFFECDVSKEENVRAAMEETVKKYGGLNILVNNAVKFVFGHLLGAGTGTGTGTDRDVTAEDWAKVWGVNCVGYANCIKHALVHMKKNPLPALEHAVEAGHAIAAGSRGSIVSQAATLLTWGHAGEVADSCRAPPPGEHRLDLELRRAARVRPLQHVEGRHPSADALLRDGRGAAQDPCECDLPGLDRDGGELRAHATARPRERGRTQGIW